MAKARQKPPTHVELTHPLERFRRRGCNSVRLPSPQPHHACLHLFDFPPGAAVRKPISSRLRREDESFPSSLPTRLEGPVPPPGAEMLTTKVNSALLFPEMQIELQKSKL